MSECMNNFQVKEEQLIKIINPILDNYKITEENKETLLNFIKGK